MRIFTLLFILAAALSMTSAFLYYHAEKALSEPLTLFAEHFPIWVQNRTETAMPLYRSSKPYGQSVGQLPAGEAYEFQYAGSSGEWLYGIYKRRAVFVKDSKRQKVISFAGNYLPIQWFSYGGWAALFWLLILIGILWLMRGPSRKSLTANNSQLVEQNDSLRTYASYLEGQNGLLKEQTSERELRHQYHQQEIERTVVMVQEQMRNQLQKVEQTYISRLEYVETEREEHSRQLACIQAEKEEEARRLEYEFSQEVEALNKQFEEEVQKIEYAAQEHFDITITDMQASFDRLNNQYQALRVTFENRKAECLFFDVNFDSHKYENLLKGRQFEIFFAESVLQDSDFKILEWTSDKGFEQNIYVVSNGNPDFIFEFQGSFQIAVECKYRSVPLRRSDDNDSGARYSWSSQSQAQRYSKFSHDRKIKVMMALGICGDPQDPDSCYLTDITHLSSLSDLVKFGDRGDQCAIRERLISGYGVNRATIASALRQYISEVRGW